MKSSALILGLLAALSLNAQAHRSNFTLYSLDLKGQLQEDQVFNGFGCSGKNISPQLQWTGAPKGTKSFAITVYDPDAPTGAGWWHWLVFNIPASTSKLPAGAGAADGKGLPAGAVQSLTSFGAAAFGGACPPVGDAPHRYEFTVYALNTAKIDLGPDAQPALVGYYLNQHALAKASLLAYYGRKDAAGQHDHD